MDILRTYSAKSHDNATLHSSQSYRPCCIAGLDPGSVSGCNSEFHELCCSSSSEMLVPLLLAMHSHGGGGDVLLFEHRRWQWIDRDGDGDEDGGVFLLCGRIPHPFGHRREPISHSDGIKHARVEPSAPSAPTNKGRR